MPFQLSPGVAVVEKDFSSIVPAVSSSAGAFAGPFAWGPIEDPVRVSSESDLVTRFGAPKDENFQSFFTAANFLSYTNNMLVCRSDATNLRNASSKQSTGVAGVTITSLGSGYTSADTITVTFSAPQEAGGITATGTVQFIENAVAEAGQQTATIFRLITGVTITNPGSGYTSLPTATFSAPARAALNPATGTRATGTVTNAAQGLKIKNVSTYLDSYNDGVSAIYGPWAAKFAGSKGNGIRVVMVDKESWSVTPSTIKLLFSGAPGTSKFASDSGLIDDEVHIVVFDNADGDFSGVPGSVIEKYSFLSKLSDARRSDGSNNYYKSAINSQSKYIWWMSHETATSKFAGTTIVASGDPVTFDDGTTSTTKVLIVGATTTAWANQIAYKTAFDLAVDKSSWKIKIAGHETATNNGVFNVVSVAETKNESNVITSFRFTLQGAITKSLISDNTVTVTHVPTIDWGVNSVQARATALANSVNRFTALSEDSDYTLAGGVDDYSSSAGNILTAYSIYNNADQYDISLVPVGNVSASTANQILGVLENRKDCVVFISPNDGGEPITYTGATATTAIINYRNATGINSSYAFIDSGWKYQYDRYNDKYRWVPLNGDIAGLCARTDYSADPWFSPGGFNRGQIKNIVKLAFNPSQSDRDTLYSAGVNPVVNFPGQGTILYGDKTMLFKPSAFDRINVRRLFIVLEKSISTAAKFQMFEFNDSFTRAQFKNLVEPFLRDVQGRRGVTDFRVKCDENNNTGEIIDRNEFVADIFIKPNRSINFITLNFVAARSSVSFEEIGG
jgi:phage tail sheath protein FI